MNELLAEIFSKAFAKGFFQGVAAVSTGSGHKFADGEQSIRNLPDDPLMKKELILAEYQRLVKEDEEAAEEAE